MPNTRIQTGANHDRRSQRCVAGHRGAHSKLQVEQLHRSRGFGWARAQLTEELTKSPNRQWDEAGLRSYRYIVDFAKARVLGRYVITSENVVTLFQSEAVERKP